MKKALALLCFFGAHDMERLPSSDGHRRGLAAAHRCRRCNEYWPEIRWPHPLSRHRTPINNWYTVADKDGNVSILPRAFR